MIPTFILTLWLTGALALAMGAGAVYLGHEWIRESWRWDPNVNASVFDPAFGANAATAMLAGAALLALLSLFGKNVVVAILKLTSPASRDSEPDPRPSMPPASVHEIPRPDGTRLHVECHGNAAGQPIICTHGWGLNSQEWNYLKRHIPVGHHLILWDLPGLGRSGKPGNKDYSLPKLAGDLSAVMDFAGKPAILLGHSIGGMIILTLAGLLHGGFEGKARGLVLTHTSPTNPVRTTSGAAFLTAIENPVLVPLMYLTIALSPLFRLLNWLSYRNGSAHLSAKRGSFAGQETWQQVDFAASFNVAASPAVLARGMLAMMRYDALPALGLIRCPTCVIAADRDSTTKPMASHMIHEGIAGSELVSLAPAKHLGLVEQHTAFIANLENFLSILGTPSHGAPNHKAGFPTAG